MGAAISSKAASEKAQTMLSDNRYTYLRTDFFQTIITSVNRKQCVGIIFGTPGTGNSRYSLAVSPSVYTVLVFSPHLSVCLYL